MDPRVVNTLFFIATHPGCSFTEVLEQTQSKKRATGKMIRTLKYRHLIASDDQFCLRLTLKGKRYLLQLVEMY